MNISSGDLVAGTATDSSGGGERVGKMLAD
jgi:hypothetical protein